MFVENNQGSSSTFARCVWYDDNGDGQSEDAELDWPLGLSVPDAAKLNHSYPNVAFLMSCLNGYPESFFNLAQALLNETSAGVLAHTRVSWGSDWNAARAEYFKEDLGTGFLNTYGLALYGDPTLRHMGRVGTLLGIEKSEPMTDDARLSLITNSEISFSIPSRGSARVRIWDVAGRLVETLYDAQAVRGTTTIPWDKTGPFSGSYFITLETGNITRVLKTIVISR